MLDAILTWAHPGHGATPPATVTHYVAEPVHLVVLVAVAIAASFGLGLGIRAWRRRR